MRGLSILEILIIFAIVSIVLGQTLPDPQHALIRANVSEGLEIASTAQNALIDTCASNDRAIVRTNLDADFFYLPAGTEEDHVSRILLDADCSIDNMVVVLWTTHTGAETDPVIELVARALPDQAVHGIEKSYAWNCHLLKGDLQHVPASCQHIHKES